MTATTGVAPKTYPSLRAAWIPLAALCLAFFVEMVDNTLLGMALPTIGRDLGAGTTALQWVTGAYSLTFGGLLLTAGSMADRVGRRRVLLYGLAAFGLVSLCVVFVHTAGELIAVRAALGIACAAMAPITNSLVFRLFDDQALRMRSMTVMIAVGLSGFILGPVLGGTALAHFSWEWLLGINAPIALIAWIGVRTGVAVDDPEGLTDDNLDLPGALLSVAAIGLGVLHAHQRCRTRLDGAADGRIGRRCGTRLSWFPPPRTQDRPADARPHDLQQWHGPRCGGFASGNLARAGRRDVHAYSAFPVRLWLESDARGLANLPLIVTMLLATPISEWLGKRFGHRVACLVGSVLLASSLAGLAWGGSHGYLAIATSMVVMMIGLRTIMTICAVALVDAMDENRTSLAAALSDSAQEVGTSVGTAVVGTLIAALVTATLPAGAWSADLISSFFHGERVMYAALAVVVGLITGWGALTLTDSRSTDEH